MTRPHALLRAGFPYVKTLGMRRITDGPVDVAIGKEGQIYVLCRRGGLTPVSKLTWDDESLGNIGATDEPSANFTWPVAIILDQEGNLYISDEGTHRITVISKDGEFLGKWGEYGKGHGQLNRPSGIAFDPEGNIYVSDTLNHRIQKFTKDGKFLSTWGRLGRGEGEFNMPWGIDVDEMGSVYVVDWRNDRVQKLDPEGRFIFEFGRSGSDNAEFDRPAGITVDNDGDIYVADLGNNRIQMFNSEGIYVQSFVGDGTLSKSAIQYVMANAKALRLRYMSNTEPEKLLQGPMAVTVDDNGRMFVPDNGHSRVQVYQKEAIPLEEHQVTPPPRVPTLDTV